jgi:hypothetical protein
MLFLFFSARDSDDADECKVRHTDVRAGHVEMFVECLHFFCSLFFQIICLCQSEQAFVWAIQLRTC